MIYWLLPIVFSVFYIGLNSLGALQAQRSDIPAAQVVAEVSGQAFAAYRNAVTNYMIANPTFTGSSVPAASLTPYLAPGQPIPAGATNSVGSTPSGGHVIYAWIQMPPGSGFSMVKSLGGDASIGIVNGSQWVSPVYGVEGSVPISLGPLPSGTVLSIIQIGS